MSPEDLWERYAQLVTAELMMKAPTEPWVNFYRRALPTLVAESVAAEREACAEIVDKWAQEMWDDPVGMRFDPKLCPADMIREGIKRAAKEIRARGSGQRWGGEVPQTIEELEERIIDLEGAMLEIHPNAPLFHHNASKRIPRHGQVFPADVLDKRRTT